MGPALTLIGRLPLSVLGICLVQVGEAGPQLQDAVQGRQVEFAWRRKTLGPDSRHWPATHQGSQAPLEAPAMAKPPPTSPPAPSPRASLDSATHNAHQDTNSLLCSKPVPYCPPATSPHARPHCLPNPTFTHISSPPHPPCLEPTHPAKPASAHMAGEVAPGGGRVSPQL